MIKISVMYPHQQGARFDHDYYRDRHMPLVKARMGDACLFYTVDKGLAGGAPGGRQGPRHPGGGERLGRAWRMGWDSNPRWA